MPDTEPPKKSLVRRCVPSKQKAAPLVLLLAMMLLATPALAQTTLTFYDDFENDGVGSTPDGWTGGTTVEESFNQFQSLRVGTGASLWEAGPTRSNDAGEMQGLVAVGANPPPGDPSSGSLFNVYLSNSTTNLDNFTRLQFQPRDDSTNTIRLTTANKSGTDTSDTDEVNPPENVARTWWRFSIDWNGTHTTAEVWQANASNPTIYNLAVEEPGKADDQHIWFEPSSGNMWVDWVGSTGADAQLTGEVTDAETHEPLENATISAVQNGTEVRNTTTGPNGNYQLPLDNGTYNVTASKPGYFNESANITINGTDVVRDFNLTNRSSALDLQVRPFIKHGQTVPYEVQVTLTNETTGEEDRMLVTDDSIVTSSNPAVVSVNGFNHEVTGTSDTSINQRVTLTARWENPADNRTLTAEQNVTVANATIENIDILPPFTRWTATFSDSTIQVILVAMGAGIIASRWASSFAGVAGVTILMEMGWIMGFVSDGVAIVTVFIALFVGLNVAGNVDYQVGRG